MATKRPSPLKNADMYIEEGRGGKLRKYAHDANKKLCKLYVGYQTLS